MLSKEEREQIMGFLTMCCAGEGDDYIFRGGRVHREPGGDVVLRLDAMVLDLELPARGTSGVGWPD